MSVTEFENLKDLGQRACDQFRSIFNSEPTVGVYAPGRVNLIGEHVDYNGGCVLPIAIPAFTIMVGAKQDDEKSTTCEIHSANMHAPHNSFKIDKNIPTKAVTQPVEERWSNYVRGVMALLPCAYPAFRALILSNVPIGAGLSSSASLEVAVAKFLQCLSLENSMQKDHALICQNPDAVMNLKDQALLCQKAEHQFAGVPCGIMDQFVVLHAKQGQALLIDCETLAFQHLPFDNPDVVVLVTNSNVKHELAGSEYSKRRSDCHSAAEIMGKPSLRQVDLKVLLAHEQKMHAIVFRRAKHVVTEIDRVSKAMEALKGHNYINFGQLMNGSHKSLKDDFEVSCPELDQLVEIAQKCNGVFGSRMTGGGFGGCTVTLVKKDCVSDLVSAIEKEYTLGKASFYICRAANGAGHLFPLQ